MKALLSLLVSAAWVVSANAADPFTVAKVRVDARAPSAIEAQSKAIQEGYVAAAQTLLQRLTLEGERQTQGLPELTPEVVGPLIRGQTIENERRSTTRYLGDVSIAFNPSAVQQLLRAQGLTMVTSQAQERLLVPVDVSLQSALAQDSLSGRYAHSLTPLRTPQVGDFQFGSADPVMGMQAQLRAANLQRGLLVYGDGRIFDIGVDGTQRDLSNPRGLAGAVATLERDWKALTAVPVAQVTTATASILYDNLAAWQRLQRAINTASQISDARLDAVAKDGALMTLQFGDFARLQSEMRQKGVIVEQDPELGLIIRG